MSKLLLLLLFSVPCWGTCSGHFTVNSLSTTQGGAAYVTVPSISGCYSIVTHVHADVLNSGSSTPYETSVIFVTALTTAWAEYVYPGGKSRDSIDEDFWIEWAGGRVEVIAPPTGYADITVTGVVQSTPN
jgi:hypothetical protein